MTSLRLICINVTSISINFITGSHMVASTKTLNFMSTTVCQIKEAINIQTNKEKNPYSEDGNTQKLLGT